MLLLKVLELGVEDVVGNWRGKSDFIEELWVALNNIVKGVVSKGEVDFFVFRAFVGTEDDLSHVLLHWQEWLHKHRVQDLEIVKDVLDFKQSQFLDAFRSV